MRGAGERIRVGLLIRRKEVNLRLLTPCVVVAPDGTTERNLEPGAYTIQASGSSKTGSWGARLHTFTSAQPAEALSDHLSSFGVSSQVVPLGRPADWGGAGELQTLSHAVVVGEQASPEEALAQAVSELAQVPADPEAELAGLRRYEDELWRLEPIRLLAPEDGELALESGSDGWTRLELPSPLRLMPHGEEIAFELDDIRIGKDFHWDHTETLSFRGRLDIVADLGSVTAVNVLALDDYLAGVLGSEMRPDWPSEALAAQALAARSTVLATRGRHHYGEAFDLCNDDHCQCYYGVQRESETARHALAKVKSTLLAYNGRVADTRYSKSCGGVSEGYSVAWDDEELPYLMPVLCGPVLADGEGSVTSWGMGDGERAMRHLVQTPPDWAACNPAAHPYPDSAREMEQNYRWSRSLAANELEQLVKERTGMDLGPIKDLLPIERGLSGRIRYLKVVGRDGTVTVGRELAIRRLLSDTHLPSSAFVVQPGGDGVFRIVGIGWGHGAGLCQLGAATLARLGWKHRRILQHYYPGVEFVEM